tara:strand:+ start:1087 stop:1389 length:303 start_codon:yes stop_codon:yes gene_type:complete
MDPNPDSVPKASDDLEVIPRNSFRLGRSEAAQSEDPLLLAPPTNALLGLVIAISAVAIPISAVFLDGFLERENIVPAALELDGSKPSPPVSFTGIGKPDS